MKIDKITIIVGLLLMVLMLFYIFGDTVGKMGATGEYATGTVLSIAPTESEAAEECDTAYKVHIKHDTGLFKGKEFDIEHFITQGSPYNLELATGDKILTVYDKQDGAEMFGIDEHFKAYKIMGLCVFLLIIIALISGVNGVKAMLALFVTMLIIFGYMAPQMIKGKPAIPLTVGCAAVIIVVNILIIAGKSKKALIAAIGCLSGVVLAGLFGWFSNWFLKLSGYTGDESSYLVMLSQKVNLKDILVCGVIIGALGAVMDVAISIASSLKEISIANPEYDSKDLFKSGMNIGKDIIGSMVNTLILAYTGASLSVILVFSMQQAEFPLIKIMNMDFICTEIVRSLSGLFGMVLSIPITAFVASIIYLRGREKVI